MQKFLALIILSLIFWTNPLTAQNPNSNEQTNDELAEKNISFLPLKFCLYPSYARFSGKEQFVNWYSKDPGLKFCVFPQKPHFLGFYLHTLGEFYFEENFEHTGQSVFHKDKYLLVEGGPVIMGKLPLNFWRLHIEGEITWNIFTSEITYPDIETVLCWENSKENLCFGLGNIIKTGEASIFSPYFFAGYHFHAIHKRKRHKQKPH